jgi:hypothetical protein
MGSSTLASAEQDVGSVIVRTGQMTKYALAGGELLDTSPLLDTSLTVTAPTVDNYIKKAAVQTSLKFADTATIDLGQGADNHGTDHSVASHGIDLIGNNHHYNAYHWFA